MRAALLSLAPLALAACTELPDREGALVDCAPIDAAAYASAKAGGTAWRTVDLTGGGYRAQAAGQNMQRCWPRVQGMNSDFRRCVQRNDVVIEMRTDDAVSHYHVPARTTYMTYGEAGQAMCRVVARGE